METQRAAIRNWRVRPLPSSCWHPWAGNQALSTGFVTWWAGIIPTMTLMASTIAFWWKQTFWSTSSKAAWALRRSKTSAGEFFGPKEAERYLTGFMSADLMARLFVHAALSFYVLWQDVERFRRI